MMMAATASIIDQTIVCIASAITARIWTRHHISLSTSSYKSTNKYEWQSLACSPPGIAVSPVANSSETKPCTDRRSTYPIACAARYSSYNKTISEATAGIADDDHGSFNNIRWLVPICTPPHLTLSQTYRHFDRFKFHSFIQPPNLDHRNTWFL